MPRLTIREEAPRDHDAVAEVTAAAFGRAREARMVEAIRASDGYVTELSLVAELDGSVVGHELLGYVRLGPQERRVLALGPLSVAPAHQRTGVGSALVREGLRRAERRQEPLVLVLGHPGYYPRFGFRPAAEFGIAPPDEAIPPEAFMVVPLPAYEATLTGRVAFPGAYSVD